MVVLIDKGVQSVRNSLDIHLCSIDKDPRVQKIFLPYRENC